MTKVTPRDVVRRWRRQKCNASQEHSYFARWHVQTQAIWRHLKGWVISCIADRRVLKNSFILVKPQVAYFCKRPSLLVPPPTCLTVFCLSKCHLCVHGPLPNIYLSYIGRRWAHPHLIDLHWGSLFLLVELATSDHNMNKFAILDRTRFIPIFCKKSKIILFFFFRLWWSRWFDDQRSWPRLNITPNLLIVN